MLGYDSLPLGTEEETDISHNTALHKVAMVGVRPLSRTPVTPNQITALRLVTGLAAAAALAVGSSPFHYLGAALFVLSMLMDRADGSLARLRGTTTEFGHRFDLIADSTCNSVVFVGLGIGLRDSALGGWAILMGVVAGAAVVSILAQVIQAEARDGARAAELGGFVGFDPDDGVLAIPILVVLGASLPLLVLAATVAPVFSIFHYRLIRRRSRAAGLEGGG